MFYDSLVITQRVLHVLNGIPEALQEQRLYKLQVCHSAVIKHAPERN